VIEAKAAPLISAMRGVTGGGGQQRQETEDMRIFSFGGGQQSMAVLVLAAQKRVEYDQFIFANVGDDSEKPDTLDYVRDIAIPFAAQHKIDLIEVQRLRRDKTPFPSIYQYVIGDNRSIVIPVRMSNGAPGNRACTVDWKINTIDRWRKKHGAPKGTKYTTGLGISVDESHRARVSDPDGDNQLEYPLLDLLLRRSDCVSIVRDAGLPVPPKSACWFCPFQRTREWEDMRRENPNLFQKACDMEARVNDKRQAIGRDVVRFH